MSRSFVSKAGNNQPLCRWKNLSNFLILLILTFVFIQIGRIHRKDDKINEHLVERRGDQGHIAETQQLRLREEKANILSSLPPHISLSSNPIASDGAYPSSNATSRDEPKPLVIPSNRPTPTPSLFISERQSKNSTGAIRLLSLGRPVTSSVRGNLGLASVVTNEKVDDWLKDRWQAARNMGGDPILGEHWLQVDLEDSFLLEKVIIDWEDAYSESYTLCGTNKNVVANILKADNMADCTTLAKSNLRKRISKTKHHIIHEITVPKINKYGIA